MIAGAFFNRWLPLTLSGVLLLSFSGTAVADIEQQRALFKQVYPTVEMGHWQAFEELPRKDQRLLRDYVLWPDLRLTYLKKNLRSAKPADIEAAITRYSTLKPGRDLRYRYALHLARNNKLPAYLRIYESYYQGLGVAKLDCLALQAIVETGRAQNIVHRARELWLVGKSQVKECDPVFDWVKTRQLFTDKDYRERYALAIDARDFSLARWLGKSIDAQHATDAKRWQSARNNSERFIEQHASRPDTELARQQLVYAIERVTYADPVRAAELWRSLKTQYRFSTEQQQQAARHIALWMARDNLPNAYSTLLALPEDAVTDEVARWRARTSLRANNWAALLRDVAALSEQERDSEEWRYWRAVALQHRDKKALAKTKLTALAEERSYYGFLAADELGVGYALDHADLQADEDIINTLAAKPAIQRARELYSVGLDSRGRSEWEAAVGYLSAAEKTQAAILAYRWGWHSRAIATVAKVGEYDDLEMRYPLAFLDLFQQSAAKASIPPTWAYGIARSESLFMRDVRSHAGAIGLMQLMPATGKQVARDIRLPYSGIKTLTNPASNIRLGTSYLGQMAERYGGNRVAATAAYNAGPHRVDKWLPEQGALDARVWIENIPFNETRKYVRRVLAAETIFHWRMTGELRRLSDSLPRIQATDNKELLARR